MGSYGDSFSSRNANRQPRGAPTRIDERMEDQKANYAGARHPLHFTERLTQAVDYARHLHIERRKGTGIPYLAHLFGVASLVMGEAGLADFPVTEDMVVAALLHDAVEDHGGAARLEDIRQNFGANVARMVEGLSDTLVEDPDAKEPWEQRKQGYIDRV